MATLSSVQSLTNVFPDNDGQSPKVIQNHVLIQGKAQIGGEYVVRSIIAIYPTSAKVVSFFQSYESLPNRQVLENFFRGIPAQLVQKGKNMYPAIIYPPIFPEPLPEDEKRTMVVEVFDSIRYPLVTRVSFARLTESDENQVIARAEKLILQNLLPNAGFEKKKDLREEGS